MGHYGGGFGRGYLRGYGGMGHHGHGYGYGSGYVGYNEHHSPIDVNELLAYSNSLGFFNPGEGFTTNGGRFGGSQAFNMLAMNNYGHAAPHDVEDMMFMGCLADPSQCNYGANGESNMLSLLAYG